jgi:hypothetical protein
MLIAHSSSDESTRFDNADCASDFPARVRRALCARDLRITFPPLFGSYLVD